MRFVKTLFLQGSAGRLEAIYNPTERPRFLAVCCHPHPLYQGTMHNKTIVSAAKTLSELGGAVIRFNFRGVMSSEGRYDEGKGETDDVKTAAEFLLSEFPDTQIPLLACGFSFGAYTAMNFAAQDERVQAMIGLGFPLRLFDAAFLSSGSKPKLMVWGDSDDFNPMEKINQALPLIAEPKTIRIVQSSDHFFTGHLIEMQYHIAEWIAKTLPPIPA